MSKVDEAKRKDGEGYSDSEEVSKRARDRERRERLIISVVCPDVWAKGGGPALERSATG